MAEEEAPAPEENAAAEGEAQAPEGEAAQAPEEAAPKPPSMLVPMLLTSVLSIGGAYAIFQFAVVPSLVGGFEKVIKDSNGTLTFQLVQGEGGKKEEEGDKKGEEGDKKGEEGDKKGATKDGETDPSEEIPIVDDGDFIVINPAGSRNQMHLMVEIYLVRKDPDDHAFPDAVKKNRKRLQALVNSELSSLTVEAMSDETTKGGVASDFQRLFQKILGSSHPVKEVLISKWVMQ